MSKTLLLADDSVTIQKVVGITFASEDVELITVDNGDDALSRAREIKPDLVLADISMPGLDGYELCAAIKAEPDLAGTPVILLTGTFETFDERRTSEAGAEAHISKPFEAQALVDLVRSLLERRPTAPSEESGAQAPTEMIEDLTPAPLPMAEEALAAVRIEQPEPLVDDFGFDDLDFERESEPTAGTLAAAAQTQVLAEIPTLDPDLLPEPDEVDPLADEAISTTAGDDVPDEDLLEVAPLLPESELESDEAEPAVIEAAPDLWAAEAEATVVAEPALPEFPSLDAPDDYELPLDATVVAEPGPSASEFPELTPLEQIDEPTAPDPSTPTFASAEDPDEGKTKLLDPSAMASFPALDEPEPAADSAREAREAPWPPVAPAEMSEEEAEAPGAFGFLPEPDGAAVDPLAGSEVSTARENGDDSDIFGDPLDDTPIPAADFADEETAPDLEPDSVSSPEDEESSADRVSPAALTPDELPGEPLVEAHPAVAEEASPQPPAYAEAMPGIEELPEIEALPTIEPEQPLEPEYALEPEPAIEPEQPLEPEYALEPEPAIEPEQPLEPEYALEPEPAIEPEAPLELEALLEPEVPFEPDTEIEPRPPAEPEPPLEPEASQPPMPAVAPPSIDANTVQQALEKVAWEAFGPLSEQLIREVLKKVEEIAWEVVPQLAEQLVKEEIDRLKRDADD
jgi:CheY-like chemotaxis protein